MVRGAAAVPLHTACATGGWWATDSNAPCTPFAGVFDCKPLQVIWARFAEHYGPHNTIMCVWLGAQAAPSHNSTGDAC